MNKALLFLIFNRPDLTGQVLEKIRVAKPPRIYIACDGPRKNNADDALMIKQTRQLVLDGINWKCSVKTLFRDENLGCKDAVGSAVNWFFDNEEDGIILEDDCVPAQSFFTFCQEMLDYYKENKKVFTIHGTCLIKDIDNGASYCFTKIFHPTGWATWADRWKYYTHNLAGIKSSDLLNVSDDENVQNYWINKLKSHQQPGCSIWSPGWTYNIIKYGGYCITPVKNLICNIGFSDEMIKKGGRTAYMANMPTEEFGEIVHLAKVDYDEYAVNYLWKNHFRIEQGLGDEMFGTVLNNNPKQLSSVKNDNCFVGDKRCNLQSDRYKLACGYADGKIVLDISSGIGDGADILCGIGSAKEVVGIESNSDNVNYAQSKNKRNNLKFINGSLASLPFDDNSFDIVTSLSNTEGPADKQKLFLEIKRVLKLGGYCIISAANSADYHTLKKTVSNHFQIVDIYLQNSTATLSKSKYSVINKITKDDELELRKADCFMFFAVNTKTTSNELKYNPYGLNLDITVLCNNSCSFCWRSSNIQYLQDVTKKYATNPGIDFKLYKKIIDDAVAYKSIWWLGLCGAMGEPMMHQGFCDLSEYAASKKHFKAIITNTNGYAADKHDFNRLLNSLTDLRFSVDSIDPQTYGKIHGDAKKLEKVIRNIRMAVEFKKQHKCSSTISVRFTENEHNKGQYPQFKEFFEKLGADRTIYGRTHAFAGVLKDSINKIGSAFCNQMFRIINFNFKCELTTCCINWKLEPVFGSIKDNTLKELWEGDLMEEFRKQRLEYDICRDCSGVGVIARQVDGQIGMNHHIGYQLATAFPDCTVDIAEKLDINMN